MNSLIFLSDNKMRTQVYGQVLWIDEAGVLSVKGTLQLIALAKEQNCRVILSGDRKQHSSIARGDALRIIEEESGLPFAGTARLVWICFRSHQGFFA